MLPTQHRLRHSADIGLVRQRGQRWQHPIVVLFVYIQPQESATASRFAIAVGRHIGKATRRNRVKRRIREILRVRLSDMAAGYDCLIVARAGAATASFGELEGALVQLLSRSGILPEKPVSSDVEGSLS